VSSILNALKKVEANEAAEDPRGPQAALPNTALPAALIPGPKWYFQRWWLLILTTALFIAGAAAYYWLGKGNPTQTEGLAREVRSQLPSESTTPLPTKRSSGPSTAVPKPRETSNSQTPAGATARSAQQVQAPPPSSRIRPSEGTGPPSASRNVTPQTRASTSRSPSASRSPEDGLSLLEESKLKVMAIAWFQDPARRLAVVNGHIVKEGESVEGYSVTKIRKDDIIVTEGGRSWRVELNLKNRSG
jgi:hypothetical protein